MIYSNDKFYPQIQDDTLDNTPNIIKFFIRLISKIKSAFEKMLGK